jgi:hypothetical protein
MSTLSFSGGTGKLPIRIEDAGSPVLLEQKWFCCVDCDSSGTYRKFPLSLIVDYNGKKYCREHFAWRFKKKFLDDIRLDFKDSDV